MVAEEYRGKGAHFGALSAFNSARRIAPRSESIAANFLLDDLGEEVSREDVIQLEEALVPIINQYNLLRIRPNDGRELVARTERLIPILRSAVETKWSFRISKLNDSIKRRA